ncbi:hypothetical protein OIV83_002199 [Microbotryomycetes sp. JL201]|nr:hypothetical protein OIV83_002199 [Microbotryomycetes sp. JL201]
MTSFVDADILPASLQQVQDVEEHAPSPSAFGSSSSFAAQLPAFPRASLSPATERYAWRQSSSGTNSPQTAPPSASALPGAISGTQPNVSVIAQPSPSRQQLGSGKGLDLSKPIEAHNTMAAVSDEQPARLGVKDRVAQMNANSDPRDTASARDNIIALASQGKGADNGGPISLAAFMGGASKAPRLHRINMGPTEAEQEETERIEKEMAATRSKWANKVGANEQPAPGARSLASLLQGTIDGKEAADEKDAITERVAQKYQPVKPSKPASLGSKADEPRSMASAFGSAAPGPRLNSQRQHHDTESGPMHARPSSKDAGFGLPGLVAARASQQNSAGDTRTSGSTSHDSPTTSNTMFVQSPTEDKPAAARWSAPVSPSHGRSWSSTAALVTSDKAPEPKYSRGPALPGMSTQSKPTPSSSGTYPPAGVSSTALPQASGTPKSPPMNKSDSGSRPSSPVSVKDAAKMWGQTKSTSKPVDAALKASYGVKVQSSNHHFGEASESRSPSTLHSSTMRQEPEVRAVSTPTPSSEVADKAPAPTIDTASKNESFTPLSQLETSRQAEHIAPHAAAVDEAVQLCLNPRQPTSLPGESIHFDVYSLVTNESEPIAHNHCLFQTEILAVVNRTLVSNGSQTGETKQMFVWYGRDSVVGNDSSRIETRIANLAKSNSIPPIDVVKMRFGQETVSFGQVFGDQLTILNGLRDDFDHLETKLYTVQARHGIVFVEERDLSSANLCSGFCAVLSIVGEVYAWRGAGSSSAERQAALEFAESIADGRQVSELKEGSEIAYFWHGLDGLEYASAPFWKQRALTSLEPVLIEFDSGKALRRDSFEVSSSIVSLIDGGFGEHWVVVPDQAKDKKLECALAFETADRLADKWTERGLERKNNIKVLQLPSAIPSDLAHYARGLSFVRSDEDSRRGLRVMDGAKAREELLR